MSSSTPSTIGLAPPRPGALSQAASLASSGTQRRLCRSSGPDYRVPCDVGGDACDYPMARNLVMLAVAVASESLVRFVRRDREGGRSRSATSPSAGRDRANGLISGLPAESGDGQVVEGCDLASYVLHDGFEEGLAGQRDVRRAHRTGTGQTVRHRSVAAVGRASRSGHRCAAPGPLRRIPVRETSGNRPHRPRRRAGTPSRAIPVARPAVGAGESRGGSWPALARVEPMSFAGPVRPMIIVTKLLSKRELADVAIHPRQDLRRRRPGPDRMADSGQTAASDQAPRASLSPTHPPHRRPIEVLPPC